MVKSTPAKRRVILSMDDRGAKPVDIAKEVDLSASQVRRILPDLRETRDPEAKKARPGRPKKLDQRDLRRARREIKSGRAPDATALQRDMFPHCSPRTVERALRSLGLPGRVRRRRP